MLRLFAHTYIIIVVCIAARIYRVASYLEGQKVVLPKSVVANSRQVWEEKKRQIQANLIEPCASGVHHRKKGSFPNRVHPLYGTQAQLGPVVDTRVCLIATEANWHRHL